MNQFNLSSIEIGTSATRIIQQSCVQASNGVLPDPSSNHNIASQKTQDQNSSSTGTSASFEIPNFYMPWPARLNPNLETTRIHAKAWAYEMGFIKSKENESSIFAWDEQDFDAHDYALYNAYTYPDTPGDELDKLTYAIIWGFFFDDYFLEVYKRSQDIVGAKTYLERLLAFIPIHPTDSMPVPADPVECGLASWWSHLAFTKSVEWRLILSQSVKHMLQGAWLELSNIYRDRVANPFEYIESTRMSGGMEAVGNFIEHAWFIELPTEIAETRPLRVVNGVLADVMRLHNDILSYQREIEEEGEHSNAVLVIQRFLNIGIQDAVNLVNDVLSFRIHQLENTVSVELPLFFEANAIDPVMRITVLLYVRGVLDWIAGDYEWHEKSGRYTKRTNNYSVADRFVIGPTGLGTSVARFFELPRDSKRLGGFKSTEKMQEEMCYEFELPEFYMPFSAQINRYVETARIHTKKWAYTVGIVSHSLDRLESSMWDERKFDSMDFALLAALTRPNVPLQALELKADWLVWTFFFDDYFHERYKRPRDLLGGKAFVDRMKAFISVDTTPTVVPTNPLELGLLDLWQRTTPTMSVQAQQWFAESLDQLFTSGLWELINIIEDRTSDPIDYIEMRRQTVGADSIRLLSLHALIESIPPDIYSSIPMLVIKNAFSDWLGLSNDIFSYRKEIEFEGEINNFVLILKRLLDCTLQQAVEIVNDLLSARLQEFEYITTVEIPTLFTELSIDTSVRQKYTEYVKELQNLMAGTLIWSTQTHRYKDFKPNSLSQIEPQIQQRLTGATGHVTSSAQAVIPFFMKQLATTDLPVELKEVSLTELGVSAIQILTAFKTKKVEIATPTIPSDAMFIPTGLGVTATQILTLLKARDAEIETQPIQMESAMPITGLGVSAMHILMLRKVADNSSS